MLSDDEKQKIYEEEKARKEAQDRIKQKEEIAKKEVDKKNARRVGVGCLSIIAGLLVLGVIRNLTGNSGDRSLLAQTSLSCAPAPDEDDSTLYDTPRPPIPSRFLHWRASHTQAAFLYNAKTGGWQFLAFQDSGTKYPISIDQARNRLCQ